MAKLLLVRHAERPDIPANSVGNEVLLTEKGKEETRIFAQNISVPVISIHTSPIERCKQTAEIIAEVVGFPKHEIELNRDLGDPGYIIRDGQEAWKHWQSKGSEVVNEYLLCGDSCWSGFNDLNEATKIFLESIRLCLANSKKGVHIWVTHDTVLASFASRALDSNLSLSQWPDFLGYLAIELFGHELQFAYHQTPKPIEE